MYDYELINTICIFVILIVIVNESYIFHGASNGYPHCAYAWNQSSTIGQEYIATTEMRYNTDIISYA